MLSIMSEILKQQQEEQLEDIKTKYLDAWTQQLFAATHKDLTALQDDIASDTGDLADVIADAGIVEETIGLIPQYLLDSYISGGVFAAIVSPLMLKNFFNDTQLLQIKEFRKEFGALSKKLGKDSFSAADLQKMQQKHLNQIVLEDEHDFYQDSDEVNEQRSIDFSDKDQILFSDVQSEKFNWNKKT